MFRKRKSTNNNSIMQIAADKYQMPTLTIIPKLYSNIYFNPRYSPLSPLTLSLFSLYLSK